MTCFKAGNLIGKLNCLDNLVNKGFSKKNLVETSLLVYKQLQCTVNSCCAFIVFQKSRWIERPLLVSGRLIPDVACYSAFRILQITCDILFNPAMICCIL